MPPFSSTIRTSLPLVLNELWCRLRNTWLQAWLISLVLPQKINLAVHTKCWSILHGLRSWIYRAKTSEKSQAWSHMFLNLRQNSEHVDPVISGTGRPQENRIFRFLNIHEKSLFIQIENFFSPKFIGWNIGSDEKVKILTIWAL